MQSQIAFQSGKFNAEKGEKKVFTDDARLNQQNSEPPRKELESQGPSIPDCITIRIEDADDGPCDHDYEEKPDGPVLQAQNDDIDYDHTQLSLTRV